jgi:RND family efflux transporter MFP subunit
MKAAIRRIVTLVIIAGIGTAAWYFGRGYLLTHLDTNAIRVVGMIEAPEVNVTSRIAGRIAKLDLLEGDEVRKGQVIATIEDVDLRNLLEKAKADLLNARANLGDAERTAKRDASLFATGVISTKENDDAQTKLEQARAAVASAEANVNYYADQLTDAQIRSPIDGVIVNKALEAGEWVTPGTPIVTIDDLSTIWARVDVQETDLHSIYVGKAARIVLPTEPPTQLSGTVMAVGQEGEFATEHDVRRGRQDIRTFYVKVRVMQPDGSVKPGMTAEVSFSRRDGKRFFHFRRRTDQALR